MAWSVGLWFAGCSPPGADTVAAPLPVPGQVDPDRAPRVLGTDRWRVPARAAGLVWRGDTLVTVVDRTLLSVDVDGVVRAEALPEAASAVAARGDELWIGTTAGEIVRLDGPGRREAPEPGAVLAVAIGADGALTALGRAPGNAREAAWVAQWAADGGSTGGWTLPDCQPRGVAALRGAVAVACGRALVWLAPGAPPQRVAWRAEAVGADPAGTTALTAGPDGVVAWPVLGTRPTPEVPGWAEVAAASGRADALVGSPDGRTLGGRSGTRIWRVPAGASVDLRIAPEAHDARVVGVALSADGRSAASVALDNVVLRWDVADARVVEAWQLGRGHPAAVAIAGDRLVVAIDKQVLARDGARWDLPDWVTHLSAIDRTFYAHTDDGRRFRLGSTGPELAPPAPPPGVPVGLFPAAGLAEVTAAASAPSGFVTGHADGTVRAWSAAR